MMSIVHGAMKASINCSFSSLPAQGILRSTWLTFISPGPLAHRKTLRIATWLGFLRDFRDMDSPRQTLRSTGASPILEA